MKDEVRIAWEPFNRPLEGRVPWMYLDSAGLVRTGVGYLLDSGRVPTAQPDDLERARSLQIVRPLDWRIGEGGDPASDADIDGEWDLVKSRVDLVGRGYDAFDSLTKLRLSADVIDELVVGRLAELEHVLRRRTSFAEFDTWPADAQLGLLSMSWSTGPWFANPEFQQAVTARDWTTAARTCGVTVGSESVRERNDQNRQLFENAGVVEDTDHDPEELLFVVEDRAAYSAADGWIRGVPRVPPTR